MSEGTPEFTCGERMQAMCTTTNKARGIYARCGVVLRKLDKYTYKCFLETGEFIDIEGCQMSHVDEETYQGWKKNGIDTSNPTKVVK